MAMINVHHTWSCTQISEVELPDKYKKITDIEIRHGGITVHGIGQDSKEFTVSEVFIPDNDPDYSGSPDIVEAWMPDIDGEQVYGRTIRW